uniref:Piwi-like protein 1 n=1 Tax=Lygus hesperus TaxID=30085 RepID=A0A146L2S0_LYGHE
MAGLGRGGGRGESLRRLLQGVQPTQIPEPPVGEGPAPPEVPTPRAGGRGALLSRLTSLLPQAATAAQGGAGDASPPKPVGMGRARLFGLTTPSGSVRKPLEPQQLLSPPREREASKVGDVSRGAQRTAMTHHRSSSSDSNETSPGKDLSKLKISERPDSEEHEEPPVIMTGFSGNPMNVAVNYIRIRTQPGKGIYQYDVKFKPEIDSRNLRFSLLKQLVETIGDTKSFDGAILYLPKKLPDEVTYGKTIMPADKTEVRVKITFVKEIRMGHPLAIHLYNVLFRRIMNILGLALHGRHFFDPMGAKPIPEHKLEVWPGFVTAIQEFEDGVMLCCDASHRVLRKQTVSELMTDLVNLARGADSWKQEFTNLMISQQVLTKYNNKVYRVDDIDFESSPMNTFPMRNGDEITYVDYYKRHYDVDIIDKGQPLLKSKVKAKVKGQEMSQIVDLIPELCYLSGITDTMRADFKVMKSIAQHTMIAPSLRQKALMKFLRNINENKEVRSLLDSWGLHLEDTNLTLPARCLAPEDIYFGRNTMSSGSFACDWTRGATNNPMLSVVDLESWYIICTKRDEKIAEDFVSMCSNVSSKIGIQVKKPTIWTIPNDNTQCYIQQLQRLKSLQVQIVVVILPIARADKYAAVKKMCCIEFPIPSQVIITKTIRSPDKLRSVTQKIVLQMNCKLGGTLWSVKIPMKNTMVVGLDTYHDASQRSSSVGAIVASMNPQMSRWYSRIYKQGVGIELIDGLRDALRTCVVKYREVNNVLPDQIFIYRDGVGDGQIAVCVDHEVPQLIAACQHVSPNYIPKFLVVVVQKRISTRFYTQQGNADYINPPPGSVLDHSVTRRDMFDFFLVSQNVRQGTVAPTHYIVAHNTTNMDPDKIQRFSYKLTHLYYNWCGTVRVPAPCQYAHKLASLVGDSIHKEADESLADKLYYL